MGSPTESLIVWVDLETTGLDPVGCEILEIGVAITDLEGNDLEGYSSLVLNPHAAHREGCDPIVQEMHDKSGLWLDIENAHRTFAGGAGHPSVVERDILDFLKSRNLEPGMYEMAGSSVQFDRGFLFEHMKELHNWFHYRNLDITSIKNACRRVNPSVYAQLPEGRKLHRVLADIADSVAEYQFYLDNFLHVSLPVK